jgi:ribosomal protein S18 acetylase RimI-like enzyme
VIVRPARADDRAALSALRDSPEAFERYLGGDGFLVVERAGVVVGFTVLVTTAGKSHVPKVSDLHVGEAYRRGGAATALIRACETQAAAAGFVEIFGSVAADNAPMLRLVTGLGYQRLQDEPYLKQAPTGTYLRFDLRRAL